MDLALHKDAAAKVQEELYENFQPILALIEQKQREAVRDHAHAKISTILKRLRKNFVTDHPNEIRKNEATALLENIEAQLPRDAVEADSVLDGIRRIGRDFKLADEPRSLVADPQAFRDALNTLVYGVTNAVQASS